jgi:hypothetical protein
MIYLINITSELFERKGTQLFIMRSTYTVRPISFEGIIWLIT